MKVQKLILVATCFYLAYTQLVDGQPRNDCQTSCGNVTIEYPFGISQGCYYADDPSFNLTCNKEKLFFRLNLEVISISHSGELRAMNNISYTCYDSQGTLSDEDFYLYRLANDVTLNPRQMEGVKVQVAAVQTSLCRRIATDSEFAHFVCRTRLLCMTSVLANMPFSPKTVLLTSML
ncbi:hypothetical protein Rs2_46662 [Raphanus sativus]|nr:hypothetical protein Rs2_46662 [Raphanus sativus]